MEQQIEQSMERLKVWARTLANQAESAIPYVRDIYDGDRPLPDGCPSKGVLAKMQISNIRSALQEVQAAYRDVESSL